MTSNPLENDPEREARIRARAYHLWEEDGRPHGRDVEFWERARALVGMEESASSGLLPNPAAPVPVRAVKRPVKAAAAKAKGSSRMEAASIQENLGETPGPLTAQGDRPPTPRPRARRKS